MTNATNAKQGGLELPDLFSTLCEIETVLTTMDQVKSLMQIFEEHEETELSWLTKGVEEGNGLRGSVLGYLNRREMGDHLFYVIEFLYTECLEKLHKLIDTSYEIEKTERMK